jgi:hypothetical protein
VKKGSILMTFNIFIPVVNVETVNTYKKKHLIGTSSTLISILYIDIFTFTPSDKMCKRFAC